jgi:hypothetical protein
VVLDRHVRVGFALDPPLPLPFPFQPPLQANARGTSRTRIATVAEVLTSGTRNLMSSLLGG